MGALNIADEARGSTNTIEAIIKLFFIFVG